jgi:hypothetical protein
MSHHHRRRHAVALSATIAAIACPAFAGSASAAPDATTQRDSQSLCAGRPHPPGCFDRRPDWNLEKPAPPDDGGRQQKFYISFTIGEVRTVCAVMMRVFPDGTAGPFTVTCAVPETS